MFYDGIDNRGALAATAPRCVMGICPGGYEVISVKGDMIDCKVPAENSGKPVVGIGARAFRGNKTVRCVETPASVTKIGTEAFAGCSVLSEAVINGAVSEIGALTFFACSSLKSVKIASGTRTISKGAFSSCTALENIVLPDTVTMLGDEVFRDCTALKAVVLPLGISMIGRYAFFGCNDVKLYFMGSAAQWSGVRFAMGNDNISAENVLFYSETEPASDMGAAWHYIDGVPTPWLLKPTIGGADGPAYGSILTAMGIGGSNDKVTETVTSTAPGGMSRYDGYCDQNFDMTYADGGYIITKFKGYQNAQVCVIPEDYRGRPIIGIGKSAFEGVKGLTNINLSQNIVVIGPSAFLGCTGISSIAIPDTVKVICDSAFRDCSALVNIAFVGEGLVEVGKCAFAGCKSLVDIRLPKTVSAIGNGAFFECEALKSFTVPEDVKRIEEDTFKHCRALAKVNLSKVTEIGYEAFLGTALTAVELPDDVKLIDSSAFASCESLKSVVIPTSLAEVGKAVFSGSMALEMVFYKGKNEEELDRHIRFGRGNDNLFDATLYCYSDIRNEDGAYWHYVDGVPTPWVVIEREKPKTESAVDELIGVVDKVGAKDAFGQKGGDEPRGFGKKGGSKFGSAGDKDGDADARRGSRGFGAAKNGDAKFGGSKPDDTSGGTSAPAEDPYAKFADDLSYALRDGGYEVVRYQGVAAECTIPEEYNGTKVSAVGQSAFFGSNLKRVRANDNITNIGDFAFSRSAELTGVDSVESVLKIGESAFEGCSRLADISVTSVTEMAAGAFKRCSSLASITISHQLVKIGKDAFSMCDSLKKIFYIGIPRHFDDIDVADGNHAFLAARVYYYSFDRPTTSGDFWHLVDGVPTIW